MHPQVNRMHPQSESDAPQSESGAPQSEPGAPQSEPSAPQGRRRRRLRPTLQDRVQDSAYQILSERGPMKRSLLTEMVIESGVEMNAQKTCQTGGKDSGDGPPISKQRGRNLVA